MEERSTIQNKKQLFNLIYFMIFKIDNIKVIFSSNIIILIFYLNKRVKGTSPF